MARRVTFLLFNEVDQSYQICNNISNIGRPFKFDETVTQPSTNTTQNLKRKSILKESSESVKYNERENPALTVNMNEKTYNSSSSKRLSNIISKRRNSLNSSLLRCLLVNTSDGKEESDDGIEEITFPLPEENIKTETGCSSNFSAETDATPIPSISFTNLDIFVNMKYIDEDEDEENVENVQSSTELKSQIILTDNLVDRGIDLTSDTTPQKSKSTSLEASANELSNYFSDSSNASTLSSVTFPSTNTWKISPVINCIRSKTDCDEVNCYLCYSSTDVICTSHELHFKCPCCSVVKTLQPGLNYYYFLKHIFNEDHPHKIMQQLKNCICPSVEETNETMKRKNSLPIMAKSLVCRLGRLTKQTNLDVETFPKQCVL
ncbi:hypothetical protein HELRODRAFT_161241 [Helobdella robusta]|uniref:Uncharacterized protein n=1 Tax=Helobdella robusta TaxID=6412 RepID=T1ER91_HELRO|nr:hypothetical protein HELRODRAFT_161241 [Helobdella robusta]ESO02020.1 hypothetical protein HELRODRAFT_161241 [Helobdella robusta]